MIKWFKKSSKEAAQKGSSADTENEIRLAEKVDLQLIHDDFKHGFDFIRKFPKSVSFFGSARTVPGDEHYEAVKKLAGKIAKETDYAVITGGGPGVMEAANCGAAEAGGVSAGVCIKLPQEQVINPCAKEVVNMQFFFSRKTILTFAAEAYIFSPGGFGTLDEFFDILTLVQTGKISRVPIILFGSDFWKPLDAFIQAQMVQKHQTVNPAETQLYVITDDMDEIVKMIQAAPVQNWWKFFQR